MRVLITILLVLLAVALFPVVLLTVVLIIKSDALHTRLFGFGVIAVFASVLFFIKHFSSDVGRPIIGALLLLLIAGGLLGYAYQKAPAGQPAKPTAIFQSVDFEGSPPAYPRWHPANLMAEADQLQLFGLLWPLTGDNIDGEDGTLVRKALDEIYQEIDYYSPEMKAFGSRLFQTYADWAGKGPGPEHLYLYLPASRPQRAGGAPVIILLHGRIGNLKANLWSLKMAADALGMAIVTPTLGAGDWGGDEGMRRIKTVIALCQRHSELNGETLLLAGVGSGGRGVTKAMRAMPERFRGAVFIGAEIDHYVLNDRGFREAWGRKPILVMHGTEDSHVPIKDVDNSVSVLDAPFEVSYHRFPNEGGYLLYTKRREIAAQVEKWIRSW